MNDAEKNIEDHYAHYGLVETVRDELEQSLKGADQVDLDALAPFDEFHIRGREATLEMIELAGFASGSHVLDVGCGVGGPSRWLAKHCTCRVTGLDITEAFCTVATELAERTGMQAQVDYRHGSALDMPFGDNSFDGVWMQHVNMNIEDKQVLFSECRRVLRPGGTLVFYEIIEHSGEAIRFPVPWARTAEISFLVNETGFRQHLENAEFRINSWQDVSEPAACWFRQMLEQVEAGLPPVLATRALKQAGAALLAANMLDNLDNKRVSVVRGVAIRQ